MDDPTQLRTVFDPGRTTPVTRRRVLLDLGEGRTTRADVVRPASADPDAALPVVLFIPGDAPQFIMDGLLEWGQYRAWSEAVADRGFASIVAEHASTNELRDAVAVTAEIRDTLAAVRARAADLRIDPARLLVWTASGGASYGAIAALEADPPVAALVIYYGLLDLRGYAEHLGTLDAESAAAVSAPVRAARLASIPPTLLVTAGKDHPGMNATGELFAAAVEGKGDLRRLHHPDGQHAFDILDDDAESARIIADTLDFIAEHLGDA
ncbi:MAG: alpha/beta hydrolase [Chloroflexota bacterium]